VTPAAGGRRLAIPLGPLAGDARLGDSIAVNGICLTIAALDGGTAQFDAGAETLRKTTLGEWQPGQTLNLEPALKVGDRLGGHLVAGHVDGVGRLLERRAEGGSQRYVFVLPEDGSVQVVEKGSVAIDGVSLTTWDCRGARFAVSLIPHTLERTGFAAMQPGARVNMEQDPIGRWVQKMLVRE
jgi:riboflavin synthase